MQVLLLLTRFALWLHPRLRRRAGGSQKSAPNCKNSSPQALPTRPAHRKTGKHSSTGAVSFQEQKVADELAPSAWQQRLCAYSEVAQSLLPGRSGSARPAARGCHQLSSGWRELSRRCGNGSTLPTGALTLPTGLRSLNSGGFYRKK